MKPTLAARNTSRFYLWLVPFVAMALGFGVGYVSYKIYLPVWLINVCLMGFASWTLGLNVITQGDAQKKHLAAGAFFLIVPFILISMFAGLGPPPESPQGWVETASEQQIRYSMLIIAGVFVTFGFAVLRDRLKNTKGSFSSLLGFTAIAIAIPLFIINMAWWGKYLPELFRFMVESGMEKRPDWFTPVRMQFGLISAVEVALTYAATALFAAAFRANGWIGKVASGVYVTISVIAFVVITLSVYIEQLAIPGFIVSIPAMPFLMPYFMGIALLRRVGE